MNAFQFSIHATDINLILEPTDVFLLATTLIIRVISVLIPQGGSTSLII